MLGAWCQYMGVCSRDRDKSDPYGAKGSDIACLQGKEAH